MIKLTKKQEVAMIYFKRGDLVSLCEGFDVEKSAAELCRRWDLPAVVEVTSEVVLVDGSVVDYLIADTYIDITPCSVDA